ncbi:hypothetical protein ACFOD7_18750 [Paracoccus fontiphilus]|uniref:Uncharacterized protein n=1 Tax=Paracoccus fontiphilus TaxID=1815556 RepID=A0ABV7IHW9_9RHOB
MRHLVDQQPGQGGDGGGVLDLDRSAHHGPGLGDAQGRRKAAQQAVAVDVQVEVREPVLPGEAGPQGQARRHIKRAQHRAAMRRDIPVPIRDKDMARHVVEEKHDARIGGQVIAVRGGLSLGLPEDPHHAVEPAPADRVGRPDALGLAGHRVAIAHRDPVPVACLCYQAVSTLLSDLV